MSSQKKTQIPRRVWRDKLDFFLSQCENHADDSLINIETSTDLRLFVNTKSKTSKFMKLFKNDDNSDNEAASASTGEISHGEDEFRSRRFGIDLPITRKVKFSNFLKNGWNVSIKKQKKFCLRHVLPHLEAVSAGKGVNSKVISETKNFMRGKFPFQTNFNGNCIY